MFLFVCDRKLVCTVCVDLIMHKTHRHAYAHTYTHIHKDTHARTYIHMGSCEKKISDTHKLAHTYVKDHET